MQQRADETNRRRSVHDQELMQVPSRIAESVSRFVDLQSAKVIDFGCGQGVKTLGVALNTDARAVVGVDIYRDFDRLPTFAGRLGVRNDMPENLSFMKIERGQALSDRIENADVIYSWSVFEHLPREQISEILADHRRVLAPNGVGFMQVDPLYFSPWGAHLRTLVDVPWAHLSLTLNDLKQLVFDTRRRAQSGLADQLRSENPNEDRSRQGKWRTFATLNRITYPEIRREILSAGFEILDEVTSRVDLEPPESLLDVYDKKVLTTGGFRVVYRPSRERTG